MLDLLALALLQTAPAAQTTPAGPPQWIFRENTDAATGKKAATAFIRAADGSGRLIVRCDTAAEPIVSIQYIPKPALPASDSKLVTVTFDEGKAEMAGWEFPGQGAYYGEPISVFLMAQQVAAAKKIRVTTENPEGMVVESLFTGPGSDAMFRQVYAACGFPYEQPKPIVNPRR
jgi:hypothetical protein